MRPYLHVSRMHVTGFLLALLICVSCKKEEIPADPSESPAAALSKSGVANLELPIVGQSQTKTATRFNDYPDRMWPDNFTRFNAANVATDDNSYIYSGKLSSRKNAMVVLQGFGFAIPPGANIDNIYVRVIRFKNGNALLRDHFARLNKYLNDNIGALSQYGFYWQNHEYYSNTETEVIYSQPGTGTVTPTSTTTYHWTPSMINDPDFGVMITTIVETTGSAVVYYDLVEITVEFTIP